MAKKVKYAGEYCESHDGHFNWQDQPIDHKGRLLHPGARTCNHSDCVRESHIITPLELERNNFSYRTKQRADHQTQYNNLMKERP